MKTNNIKSVFVLGLLLLAGFAVAALATATGPFYSLSSSARNYVQCDHFTAQFGYNAVVQNTGSVPANLNGVLVDGVPFGLCETGQTYGAVYFPSSAVRSVEIFDPQGMGHCDYAGQSFQKTVTFNYRTPNGSGSQTQRMTFTCVGAKAS